MKGVKKFADATCLACGCLCDDITLSVETQRIVKAERACPIGERWFLADRPTDVPACRIAGEPASDEAGYARAAEILRGAKFPLFTGLGGLTCEAHRIVVGLADRLGGCIGVTAAADSPLDSALQSVGMVTATLGEVRHRADVVIFWGGDPAVTHPRHFERYSLEPRGEFVPNGRKDRKCIVVGPEGTATSAVADLTIECDPRGEATEIAIRELIELFQNGPESIRDARYVALFFDPDLASESLLTLVRDMNHKTRFVCLPLGEPGNAAGAKQLLACQTGRVGAIDFSSGEPREAFDFLSTDAALLFECDPVAGSNGKASLQLCEHLQRIPRVVIHTADITPLEGAAVTFAVATSGIHAAGTVFRSDGVPLPLRTALRSRYPAAETVLEAVVRHIDDF
jgi:formylmethanofuran dehydrogenase subunit B